jgi:hypothetical protein
VNKNSWDKTTRVFIQVGVLAQKKPGPIRKRRDGEGACSIRGTSCGGLWPQDEACSKFGIRV